MPRKVKPKRVAQLQRRYLQQQGATPEEIRRYQPILTAQIGQESNFTQGVGSPAGARDIAQFMPTTAPGYGVTLGDNRIKDDIRGQVKYMLPLLRKYGVEGALRGYNAGVGAIERSKGFSETNNYVQRIRSSAGQYRAAGGSNPVPSSSQPLDYQPAQGGPTRQQALLGYLANRGKPNALLELKANLDAASSVAAPARVSAPRQNDPRDPSSPQIVHAGHWPTAKHGNVIGTPYSGTHSLGNWQSDNAVDIAVPNGTRILAATKGKVVKVRGSYNGGSSRFDGFQVTIQGPHGGLFYTHLSKASVKVGQTVHRGQVIGRSGSANGVAHLHFGREKGDPRDFLT